MAAIRVRTRRRIKTARRRGGRSSAETSAASPRTCACPKAAICCVKLAAQPTSSSRASVREAWRSGASARRICKAINSWLIMV